MNDATLLGDRYILGPLLGRGGMAEVRRGRDIRLERDVAIKRLRPDLAGDPIFQARFRREAQAAAGLNHPNIVSVYDTGEQYDPAARVDIPYIVMELVVGHTLRDILQDNRKLQPERALELVQSVLAALEYSHRHGIIHRDIKPANVMVTAAGEVKVMDFGIARAVSDTAASMTQTAAVIGTPQYLSPEQIRGETVDRRSDIYATGCLLYELLAGRPPFQGDSPVSLAYQHVREQPIPPSHIDPVVSVGMDAIVLKALAKAPDDRYQTAKAMSDDIGRLLAGQQVTAVVPAPLPDPSNAATQLLTAPVGASATMTATRALPVSDEPEDEEEEDEAPKGRRTLIIVIVALAVLLLGVGGYGAYWLTRSKPPETTTVTMPPLTSFDRESALAEIARLGLVANDVVEENGPAGDTVNTVVKQDPAAGQVVEAGSHVTITINIGPKKVKIPDGLVGKDKDEVVRLLQEAGFTNVQPPTPASKEDPNDQPNAVTSLDPSSGDYPADTTIRVYYATGQTTMPSLTGMTETEAVLKLGSLGFKTPHIEYRPTTEAAPGIVVGQNPGVGVGVKRTEVEVTLEVAVAPTPPSPPPVEPTPPPSSSPSPSESPTP
jgi:serine/threonine-protein kinase